MMNFLLKRENREFVFYFLIGFFISLPVILLTIENPDLGWHLSTAKWMVQNLKVPHYDILSWTKEGTGWINSEWGSQLIFYSFYSLGGYKALYILRLINIFLISSALSYMVKTISVKPFNLVWFLPSFFMAILNLMDLRPDNYTVFLFIILFVFLYKRINDEVFNKKDGAMVFLIFVIWANMHPGYNYGIMLMGIFLAGSLLNENLNYIYGKENKISFLKSKKFFYFILIALISTLINPYGYKIYSVFFEHFENLSKYQTYIVEWQEINIDRLNLLFFYFYVIFSLIVYLYKFLKERKVDFIEVFLMVFFTINSVLHVRLNVYGAIIAGFIILKIFSDKLENLKYKIVFLVSFLPPVYYISFNILSIEFFNILNGRYYIASGSYLSTEFIKKNHKYLKNLKMYNGWSIGGFLSFELYGYKKTFMDGRYIFTDMLEEHIKANSIKGEWDKFANKYGIDMAVFAISRNVRQNNYFKKIGNTTYRFQRPYYFDNIDFNKWALIYFDKRTMIIVRRDKIGIDFLKDNEYIFLKPYDFDRLYIDTMIDKKYVKQIKKELIRYISHYNGNPESFSDLFIYIFHDMIDIEKGKFKYE